jgi:hypothetical protein
MYGIWWRVYSCDSMIAEHKIISKTHLTKCEIDNIKKKYDRMTDEQKKRTLVDVLIRDCSQKNIFAAYWVPINRCDIDHVFGGH